MRVLNAELILSHFLYCAYVPKYMAQASFWINRLLRARLQKQISVRAHRIGARYAAINAHISLQVDIT